MSSRMWLALHGGSAAGSPTPRCPQRASAASFAAKILGGAATQKRASHTSPNLSSPPRHLVQPGAEPDEERKSAQYSPWQAPMLRGRVSGARYSPASEAASQPRNDHSHRRPPHQHTRRSRASSRHASSPRPPRSESAAGTATTTATGASRRSGARARARCSPWTTSPCRGPWRATSSRRS